MNSLNLVYSRYARTPRDGKQVQLKAILPVWCEIFDEVNVLGLARSSADLEGDLWPTMKGLGEVREVVWSGSYETQAALGETPIGWQRTGREIRSWVQRHDGASSFFFFEGFPLARFCGLIDSERVYWGEVDSYLRRAHRLCRSRTWLYQKLALLFAARVEREGLRRAKKVHVYSERDARFMRAFHRVDNVFAVPVLSRLGNVVPFAETSGICSSVLVWADSTYSYLYESVVAFLSALEGHHARRSVRFFFLVGKNPRLVDMISKMGYCAYARLDDLDGLFAKIDYVLLPDLSGTGIKNRALHSMSCGRFVVGTRAAWEGIPFRNGIDGFRGDQYSDMLNFVSSENAKVAAPERGSLASIAVHKHFGRKAIKSAWQSFFFDLVAP
jgi:hypothetical protein